jgi:hypothetical protein
MTAGLWIIFERMIHGYWVDGELMMDGSWMKDVWIMEIMDGYWISGGSIMDEWIMDEYQESSMDR